MKLRLGQWVVRGLLPVVLTVLRRMSLSRAIVFTEELIKGPAWHELGAWETSTGIQCSKKFLETSPQDTNPSSPRINNLLWVSALLVNANRWRSCRGLGMVRDKVVAG